MFLKPNYAFSMRRSIITIVTYKPNTSKSCLACIVSTYSKSCFCKIACTRTQEIRFVIVLVFTDFGSYALAIMQKFVLFGTHEKDVYSYKHSKAFHLSLYS